jgi:hypothetical protein
LGGAACIIIVKYLKDTFQDPTFHGFVEEQGEHLTSQVDAVLAKAYADWTEADGDVLFHAWRKIFKEYLGQYTYTT